VATKQAQPPPRVRMAPQVRRQRGAATEFAVEFVGRHFNFIVHVTRYVCMYNSSVDQAVVFVRV
jgi:hypothetical protein